MTTIFNTCNFYCKPFSFGLVLLFVLLFSVSCNNGVTKTKESSTNSKTWKKYQSDSLHFSISYPPTWQLQVDTLAKSITLFEPLESTKDAYQDNLMLWVEEMPMAVKDSLYARAAITQLRIANPTIDIKESGKISLGQQQFHSFNFDFTTKDSNHYNAYGYLLSKGIRGYNVSCTTDKKDSTQKQLFESILKTFSTL